jgi:hypothetical protein
MEHYAGMDVSLEQASACIVDATGRLSPTTFQTSKGDC